VWAVDEHYVQTALANSPRAGALIDENLWHIEWAGAHPRTLRAADAPRLIEAGRHGSDAGGSARGKLFARKFDMDLDRVVLDRLDAELLGVHA
jgi:hypothetical protein